MHRDFDHFHAALERDPAERAAFVERQHADDPELVRRLLKLLAAHERAEQGARDPSTLDARDAVDPIPERIGPYRIRQRIGEGGMGVVYSAEQLEPLRRDVAIKVIKLGMDTREVLARFEVERQTLAMLDHPGIARVLDAGVTEAGRPYFVMELVRGLSLVDYCKKHDLPLDDRLRLFVDVCAAIQHAHQNGIIHRDIKPSNVLVGLRDERPAPKVIDFGVAKATATQRAKRTLFTEQGRMIGTPEYMSPEQAEMSGLDVDTRTDVYSLGVILYELLTDELPFASVNLRARGHSEVARIIREVHPPRPSTRIVELLRGAGPAPAGLGARVQRVRGELDWIVLRAMEKDRTKRYATASALGEDVGRFLQNLPVLAGPPGFLYTFRKFVRRHRVATTLVAALLLSMVIGVSGLVVGLLRAREAEELASRRAEHAQATSTFLQRLLFQSDPEYGGGNPTLHELLASAGQLVEDELRAYPDVEASVRDSLGVAYRRRSMYTEAAPHLYRALEIRRRAIGEYDLATAQSYVAMANFEIEYNGAVDASRGLLERAVECFRRQGMIESVGVAWILLDVGLVELVGDRPAEAARAFAECHRLMVADRGEDHPDISRPVRGLAHAALLQGELERAEQLARRAVALCNRRGSTYIGARARLVLARVLLAAGSVHDALRVVDEACERFLRTVGDRHVRIADCDALRARLHLLNGDVDEAVRAATRCEQLRAEMLYEDHWEVLEARLLRLRATVAEGADAAALVEVDDELRTIEEDAAARLGVDHALTLRAAAARVECAAAAGNVELRAELEPRLERLRDSRRRRVREPR